MEKMNLEDFLRELCDYGLKKVANRSRSSLLHDICYDDSGFTLDQRLKTVKDITDVDEMIEADTENIIVFRKDDKYYAIFYEYNSYDGSSHEYIGEVKPEQKVITVWKR